MIQIIGWIGLVFLLVAYLVLNTKNGNKYWVFNFISCILLLIYSILIKDNVFIVVNICGSISFGFKLIKNKNSGVNDKI